MTRTRQMDQEPTLFTPNPATNVTVTDATTTIIAANPRRAFLSLFNLDEIDGVFLGLDEPAQLNKGIFIPAGSAFVFDRSSMVIGVINGITTATTTAVIAIQEGE